MSFKTTTVVSRTLTYHLPPETPVVLPVLQSEVIKFEIQQKVIPLPSEYPLGIPRPVVVPNYFKPITLIIYLYTKNIEEGFVVD